MILIRCSDYLDFSALNLLSFQSFFLPLLSAGGKEIFEKILPGGMSNFPVRGVMIKTRAEICLGT